MGTTKVKPVVLYDKAYPGYDRVLVLLGDVVRVTAPVLRTSGEPGEFETKDYIYKLKPTITNDTEGSDATTS